MGHVLHDFSSEERDGLPPLLERAVDMARAWLSLGLAEAMNRHNRRVTAAGLAPDLTQPPLPDRHAALVLWQQREGDGRAVFPSPVGVPATGH